MSDPKKEASVSAKNDDYDHEADLTMDIQRHVTRMLDRDSEQRMLLSKIKELSKGLATDRSKIGELTQLLVRSKNLGDTKIQAVESMSEMVGDLTVRYKHDNGQPTAAGLESVATKGKTGNSENVSDNVRAPVPTAAASSNTAEKPETDKLSHEPAALPIVRHHNTPMPRVTATILVDSLGKSTKPSQKTEQKPKMKKKNKKQTDNSTSMDEDDSDVMPVDPNEPTYCLCNRISFGKMICCDNDLCPIQWYHFGCISMTTQPKGKWFCPKCRGLRSNIMKPRKQFLKELEIYNKEKEESA